MILEVDARLRAEARRYQFRFTCQDCAHFDELRGGCANGYPVDAHSGVDLARAHSVIFCKEFELL